MPSNARATLDANQDDLSRLWELHEQEAGNERGRKYGVEVLNKSAVVLVCAAWEAFCEDIITEAITHIASDCDDITKLPNNLKSHISKVIREAKNDHAPWDMAGDGWKSIVQVNAQAAAQRLTGKWNTPKSPQIKELFDKALGIPDITAEWYWQRNTVEMTTSRLDEYVKLRGEIAHRLKPADSVHKSDGTGFYEHVCRLADKIDASVHAMLHSATGKGYW